MTAIVPRVKPVNEKSLSLGVMTIKSIDVINELNINKNKAKLNLFFNVRNNIDMVKMDIPFKSSISA
ncbi:hypothetical protein [Sulfuracidifex tepidarius]|uniref:hypothetical protein n=1 Tax=Sulfuracidifex tepidarius TaxID=1294262 RepID=UPI0011F39324|nr:hypothetical protein [Sulfuracidifex tepidarius]